MNVNATQAQEVIFRAEIFDKGYIELVRYSGSGKDIANAARTSVSGVKSRSDDFNLLDRLMRHRHTSPFEFANLVFRMKIPYFTIVHILRHRTGSFNQESARYSEIEDDFYIQTEFFTNSNHNKQTSGEKLNDVISEKAKQIIEENSLRSYEAYQELLDLGVSREDARAVLTFNIYSTVMWEMDIHNLLHFLKLRYSDNAQHQTRSIAEQIYLMVKKIYPDIIESWENHVLDAMSFSRDELDIIANLVSKGFDGILEYELGSNSRNDEFKKKFNKLIRLSEDVKGSISREFDNLMKRNGRFILSTSVESINYNNPLEYKGIDTDDMGNIRAVFEDIDGHIVEYDLNNGYSFLTEQKFIIGNYSEVTKVLATYKNMPNYMLIIDNNDPALAKMTAYTGFNLILKDYKAYIYGKVVKLKDHIKDDSDIDTMHLSETDNMLKLPGYGSNLKHNTNSFIHIAAKTLDDLVIAISDTFDDMAVEYKNV